MTMTCSKRCKGKLVSKHGAATGITHAFLLTFYLFGFSESNSETENSLPTGPAPVKTTEQLAVVVNVQSTA